MKKVLLLFFAIPLISYGQSNTFPTSGNVGIGISSPSEKLEVRGNTKFIRQSGGQNYIKIDHDAGGNYITSDDPGINQKSMYIQVSPTGSGKMDRHLYFRAGKTIAGDLISRMVIRGDGNIGIGTNNPGAKLDVNGAFRAKYNTSGERKIYMEAPSTGNHRGNGTQNVTGLVYRMDNPASGDPIFQIRSQGEAVRFFVEHDGWTGSRDNSAWFGGSKGNYFKGSVGIGTTSPDAKLAVNGVVHSKEVRVDLNGWSDFVFEENYELPTLEDVELHIKEKGHLKDIPSAKEVEQNGIFLGEMDARLLQKIEELTLYAIEQQKMIRVQGQMIQELKNEIQKMNNNRR
ncbi:hypothetical protein [Sinomicrobium weinanense]|uniref:Uncharacterized protein n=1 Tax=Sinomicrobium weinanense TaxID=2842200 RepID=A0A926JRA0_9FLAO|nr:hypothetical protein [Sinomicrobium weinanense]MBC9795854.1 hypothetical protein [Sinomicrobium weinanense]MBU3125374.1 hypothetical protein [Sinomicrobium weinanense]